MKKSNSNVRKINCADAVSRFNDFMDNYIGGKAKQELMNHILECRQCMDRLEFEQLLKSRIQGLAMAKHPDHTIRNIEKLIATL